MELTAFGPSSTYKLWLVLPNYCSSIAALLLQHNGYHSGLQLEMENEQNFLKHKLNNDTEFVSFHDISRTTYVAAFTSIDHSSYDVISLACPFEMEI